MEADLKMAIQKKFETEEWTSLGGISILHKLYLLRIFLFTPPVDHSICVGPFST